MLRTLGQLEPLVWNVRTGNLVSGHQRLSLLDAESKASDYLLTVSKVDLSPDEEERANLAFNNLRAQGDFEPDELKKMLARHQDNLEATGFDAVDMMQMFGNEPTELESERLQELGDKLREAREAVRKMQRESAARDGADTYLVLMFPHNDDVVRFLDDFGLEDNRYQRGEAIRALIEKGGQHAKETLVS